MKVNVKKLDETIAKLQELRRLATDPALSSFVSITGRASSNGSSPHVEAGSNGNGNGHGALKASVLAACKTLMTPTFTIKEVYAMMQTLETSEAGTEKSVANVLRLLAEERELKIALRGQGRRPTAYSNV